MRAKLNAFVGLIKGYTSYISLLIFLFVSFESAAQITLVSHRMDRELIFAYDNDLFMGTDGYYTSGAVVEYGRILSKNTGLRRFFTPRRDSLKIIGRITYGHKIFTPKKVSFRDVNEFDRPYAGWHYLNFSIQNHPSENVQNHYQVQLGVVGPGSGIGNFHRWWHEGLGFPPPRGWEYEIANEVVLNTSYERKMIWYPIERLGIYSKSGINIGTGSNYGSQELSIRYGRAGRLFNSAAGKSRISKHIPVVGNSDPEEEEGFLFYGFEGQYVLSNIFIEGSMFNESSPHTESVEKFVLIRKWGFTYSNYYTTFSIVFYKISEEVIGGRSHQYLSFNLSKRF